MDKTRSGREDEEVVFDVPEVVMMNGERRGM